MMRYRFEIMDHGVAEDHLYTVRIDGMLWIELDPLEGVTGKQRLFDELLAWLQADDKMRVTVEAK